MSSKRLRFPQINLAKASVSTLSLRGQYEWTEARAQTLANSLRPVPEVPADWKMFLSFTGYTPRSEPRVGHSITATLFHVGPGQSEDVALNIDYKPDDQPSLGRRSLLRREDRFIRLALELGEAKYMAGVVRFEFKGLDPEQLWFPLPTQLQGKTPDDLFEVRGVRGGRIGSDRDHDEYAFTLDRPSGENVVLELRMPATERFSPEIIRTTFERARKIVPKLIDLELKG